jgi:hypothetical protein
MQSRKVVGLLCNDKLQPKDIIHIIKGYAKHLQLPDDWKHYESSFDNMSLKEAPKGKQAREEVYKPEGLPCPPKRKEDDDMWTRKPRKLTRNLGEIKTNIDIVKELLEPECIEDEEVRIDRKSSRLIRGRPQGKNERYKSIKFRLGETYFEGIKDLSSNINILPYHAYESCRYYLDDHELEPTDTILVLSDRTYQKCRGVLRNAYVTVEAFVYPIDFHVIYISLDPFCPIILGAPFFASTKLNIDSEKEIMSLQFAGNEVKVGLNQLKKFSYEKKAKIKEDKTIEELAAIYFSIPRMNWREA